MKCLTADIGGTFSRLAWLHGDRAPSIEIFQNESFSDLDQVITTFLSNNNLTNVTINRMVLALPAPIPSDQDKLIRLTNIDWQLSKRSLTKAFDVQEIMLINDFQAAALGVIGQTDHQSLNPSAPGSSKGPAVVTGAGTGLGLAWFADISNPGLPQATEGGHVDFSPQNAHQRALHSYLEKRYKHVSYERVLSGEGLQNIDNFLTGKQRLAQDIHEAASRGKTDAIASIQLFIEILGSYVGNIALFFNPQAGIYLTGGLSQHLAPWFDERFLSSMTAKGRMAEQVARIPVYRSLRDDAGLYGTIQLARCS